MSYDNTNRGQIWRAKEKKTDKHPDYEGSINIEGVEYWLNGWARKPDANPKAPAVSFTVNRKEKQPGGDTTPAPSNDFDSDIPFN